MRLFDRNEKRDQRIKDQLDRVSTTVVAGLLEQTFEGTVGPLAVRAGKVPRGIELEDYINRLQSNTLARLGATSLAGSVTFNGEASLVASTDLLTHTPGYTELAPKKTGLTLVFEHFDVVH